MVYLLMGCWVRNGSILAGVGSILALFVARKCLKSLQLLVSDNHFGKVWTQVGLNLTNIFILNGSSEMGLRFPNCGILDWSQLLPTFIRNKTTSHSTSNSVYRIFSGMIHFRAVLAYLALWRKFIILKMNNKFILGMGYLFALVGNAHFLVLCLSQVNAH